MSVSTSPAFAANQSFFSPLASSLRNSSNLGTDADGSAAEKVARSCFTFSAITSDFGTRFHVVSMPLNNTSVIGVPSSSLKYSLRAPRRGGLPTPWLLCMLRLAAAISVKALPSSGLKPPASSVARPAGSNGIFRFWKKNGEVFQTSRVGFQTSTEASCSGKRFGSAAAVKASRARIADDV